MTRQSVIGTCYNEPRPNVLREAKIQQFPTFLNTDSAPVPENPPNTATVTYADAGVDIDRANRTKKRIKYLAHKTFNRGVLSEIGGFGALFAIDKKYVSPVLVSSVDGVGTKLKVAFEMKVHHTIGADLVNHCVNDIAVQGATPLFFMDYLATGTLEPEVAEKVVEGLAEACKHNGCALIGGETAEMPGFYPEGEYDLAGFIVGVVEREKIITGKTVEVGDVILGLASNGLHTNGYSLARKLLFEVGGYTPESYVNELKGKVGNELMRTHKSYWPAIKRLVEGDCVTAMAHITGGGITDNLPRMLPRGMAAIIEMGSWPVLPIFEHLQKLGNVPPEEMLRTFNMGLGMLLVVPSAKFKKAQTVIERAGEKAFTVGRIVKGERKVIYN
ncbi:MAG TPA: phosphoribosylformylglycinamidine cyclo-ligase [Terriglobales bacterium]|nr:phosphoribosylformylglycinamidine cyclo-ligase [Terriglobales bacterium]